MAYTTIDDPSAYFQTALYTGNESTNVITNDGNSDLQPDLWWGADRTSTSWNSVYDSSRGVTKQLNTNVTNSEYTVSNGMASFNSDGFTLGSHDNSNGNGENHVAWQWKANGGSRTTFTESGNNPGGGYQVNTTAGFSIVDYTGTGTAGTVAHGLGAVPHVMIFKRRNSAADWTVYHHKNTSEPATDFLILNGTDATQDVASVFNDTEPTSSVFTVHEAGKVNTDGDTFISYCFTEIQGYSKFGSYTGNGNADGPFIYTGFKPAWVMWKRTDASESWIILDSDRNTFNVMDNYLVPNSSGAEGSADFLDFTSNGIKIRNTFTSSNNSGSNFIYMCFASSPFVGSDGTPTTAR